MENSIFILLIMFYIHLNATQYDDTALEKNGCCTPEWGTFLVIIHILSACEVWRQASWWELCFFYVLSGLFCLMCILVNFWWHFLIMEKLNAWACIPKCHWMVIVVNLVKKIVLFCIKLRQYRVFPPLAAIIAARRRGMITARRWGHSTGISAHLSSRAWWSSRDLGVGCP